MPTTLGPFYHALAENGECSDPQIIIAQALHDGLPPEAVETFVTPLAYAFSLRKDIEDILLASEILPADITFETRQSAYDLLLALREIDSEFFTPSAFAETDAVYWFSFIAIELTEKLKSPESLQRLAHKIAYLVQSTHQDLNTALYWVYAEV